MANRGSSWTTAAGALLLVAVLARQGALAVMLLFVLLAAGAGALWARYAFYGFSYRRRFIRDQILWGEETILEIEVQNRKLLPIPWLEVTDEVPLALTVLKGRVESHYKAHRGRIVNHFSLRWFERVVKRYPVIGRRRGYYALDRAVIKAGDLFGLAEKEIEDDTVTSLVVLPKIVSLAELGLPMDAPFGDAPGGEPFFEDPSRFAGSREYGPGDPFNRIHWVATARTGQIHVKCYEPSTAPSIAIFLDVNTTPRLWDGYHPAWLELAVTAAASVACHYDDAGYAVGLYTNGDSLNLPPRRHPEQLGGLLRRLARVMPLTPKFMSDVMLETRGTLPWGATVVLITSLLDENVLAQLMAYRDQGHRPLVLFVGDDPPPVLASQMAAQPAFQPVSLAGSPAPSAGSSLPVASSAGSLGSLSPSGTAAADIPLHWIGGEAKWHELEAGPGVIGAA